jgi:hypothetical protein
MIETAPKASMWQTFDIGLGRMGRSVEAVPEKGAVYTQRSSKQESSTFCRKNKQILEASARREEIMAETPDAYPVSLSIDYPDRKLDRLTTFFRLPAAIPIIIILALVSGGGSQSNGNAGPTYQYAAGGILFLPIVLMLLFRQKYPRWWFDWNVALTKFGTRVSAYLALLRDEYPSTDEDQAVHLLIPYPDAKEDLNRWLPLVKWLLAIPHFIVLAFLVIAALVCVIIAWFAILFTGRYPRSLFDFVVGVIRWSIRVEAYAVLLVTDQYPPFRLSD